MFKLNAAKPTIDATFHFPGLTATLNQYQLYAVYWFHKRAKGDPKQNIDGTNGGILADAMGLGKVCYV